MKRKALISGALVIIMFMSYLAPIFRVYAADSGTNSITLNSELYTAVSTYMKDKYTGFKYNDLLRTITAESNSFSNVDELNLKESGIDDITGLENFTGLKSLNLSANYLTLDSNLEIINSLSGLTYLDLSTNQIDGFSWLTLSGLRETHFHSQTLEKVKMISVPELQYEDENGTMITRDESDAPRNVKVTTDGLLAEFDLESRDLDVKTYLTDGLKWEITNGETEKAYENKQQVGITYIDYEENEITLKDIYTCKANNKMYNVSVTVTNSNNPYDDSTIELYYIIVDESEEGIVFKDENFYKAVKKQLTKTEENLNESNIIILADPSGIDYTGDIYSRLITVIPTIPEMYRKNFNDLVNEISRIVEIAYYVTSEGGTVSEKFYIGTYEITMRVTVNRTGRRVVFDVKSNTKYKAAYDRALTLVIDKNVLVNEIPILVCDNEKIKDLTGLEKFIGLKDKFSATNNYIDSIEKVLELETNKGAEEERLRTEIGNLITKLTSAKIGLSEQQENISYIQVIETYLEEKKSVKEQIKALEEQNDKPETTDEQRTANNNKIDELKNNESLLGKRNTAIMAVEKIQSTFRKIDKTWYKSYDMATIQTATLYEIEDIDEIEDKDTAKTYLVEELNKLKSLEDDGTLEESIASAIVREFPTSKFQKGSSSVIEDEQGNQEKLGPIGTLLKFNDEDNLKKLTLDEIKYILKTVKRQDDNSTVLTKDYKENIDDSITLVSQIRNVLLDSSTADLGFEKILKVAKKLVYNNTSEMLNAVVKLPRLKNLDLSVNNIETIEGIDNLTELESLRLSDNLIITIDNIDWTKLENLTVLVLSYNPISNIDKLSELSPHLNGLDVSYCLLSGKFKFDFVKLKIHYADFSGNYYTDISFLMDRYAGKLKKDETSNSLAQYLMKEYWFSFANQTVEVDYGTVKSEDNEPIVLGLPSIFSDIEEIDPYNTTFGVVPGDGCVDEYGKTVTFASYDPGENSGYVTVQTVDRIAPNTRKSGVYAAPSIGDGTKCVIKYTANETVSDTPTTPVTPADPTTEPKPSTGGTTNGTKEATTENVVKDEYNENKTNFIYVYEPDVTVKSLVQLLEYTKGTESVKVNSVNKKKNLSSDLSRVFTTETLELTKTTSSGDTKEVYEIVVKGDIDGDGDIDTVDSAYARALRYGILYSDVTDSAERSALENAFKQTANYSAADMNLDGNISKEETAAILYYRAGLINSFKAFLPK